MTDYEIVEMYRDYVFHRDSCIVDQCLNSERMQNHTNMYRVVFDSNGVTLEQVEEAASQYAKAIAGKLFEAMFETDGDRLLFCLQCTPTRPVWVQNGNDKLCGSLDINGVESIDDKPMRILVLDDKVQLMWGYNGIPNRDRTFGPAIVDIKANKSFVGHHVMGGARVAGYSNWRKRCAKHNLWMAHV